MFDLKSITRKNILALKPYTSAREDFKGEADIWLDANESPFQSEVNRYPDPYQQEVKALISPIKGIPRENIFLGNGSDEVIDLLFRAFCEPNRDKALLLPPTYGMYKVSAEINAVALESVPLTADFQIDIPKIKPLLRDKCLKLIFICSPNNPSGNLIKREAIREIVENFHGIVVVDEAYIDFASEGSMLGEIRNIPNLLIIQTFSKAWGMAGIRLGMAFGSQEILDILNKIKPPYNINTLSQNLAIEKLKQIEQKNREVAKILEQRKKLNDQLQTLNQVVKVWPSNTNFLLVQFTDPKKVYKKLSAIGTIVRDRSHEVADCLRITIGTVEENQRLINQLKAIENEESTLYR
ncbi:histidinol-phosphate transaminase [Xanthovirga aplysinae]|uniref:histidinol-phosphate transaminase n=1 Tax=Xanthovirga aplysinae TaxID=2529853 RepID=UPI0012BBDE6C|nr:histidinol-phosphate transaminase [Xanthovirga aplysinae]MTI32218.1 histidinol-phosphate transaminase [Xanthovirga aplysinae]